MIKWIDKSLDKVERAAANARAALREKEDLKKQLVIATEALKHIYERPDSKCTPKEAAKDALQRMGLL